MTGDETSHNGVPPAGAQSRATGSAGATTAGAGPAGGLEIDSPAIDDAAAMYRVTRDSGSLDLNSSYVYLLWCRDFARTSAVARAGGAVVGFVSGYLRPDAPDVLVVWQVAVDASQRGGGVAGKLLNHLVDRVRPRHLETTITADNTASIKLFLALARDRSTEIVRSELFTPDLFPGEHDAEELYRIGPFDFGASAEAPGSGA
jgi:diaminobutyrate acetyltransferase